MSSRALRQLIGCPMPQPKTLDDIIKESIKLDTPFQHFATVIISENDIIQAITQSRPNNLILDQFGKWLAGWLRAPVVADGSVSIKDTGGTARNIQLWSGTTTASVFNIDTGDKLGSLIQVGAGTTAAARDDVNIETAFGTAPEDTLFDTGSGSYAAGAVSVSGAISAGGAGTIAEVGLFAAWTLNITLYNFMLFHDILASTEAFVAAQTITAAYTINV